MQKPLLTVVCTVLLSSAALSAVAQTDPRLVGIVTAPPDNRTGQDFVQAMMMSGKFAIVASKLALDRSHDPAVQDIARNTITNQRKLLSDLKAVTDRTLVNRRITPPPLLDVSHTKMYQLLQVNSGPSFDRIYLSQQVNVHQDLLATVEGYAGHGGVPQLHAFARQSLPAVRNQLAMLRSVGVNVAVN